MISTRKARKQLAALLRILDGWGWSDGFQHMISCRASRGSQSLLTLSCNSLWKNATRDALIEVPFNAEWDRSSVPGGDKFPSRYIRVIVPTPGGVVQFTEFMQHVSIYTSREASVNCILHCHPKYATAVSCLSSGFVHDLSTESVMLSPFVSSATPDFDYESSKWDDRTFWTAYYEQACWQHPYKIVFVQNHGVVVMGRSIAEVYWLSKMLEKACRTQIYTQGMENTRWEQPIQMWPDEAIESEFEAIITDYEN